MKTKLIDSAIRRAGGYRKVADQFGISKQAVAMWARRRVPAERVRMLARITGLHPSDIRPDILPISRLDWDTVEAQVTTWVEEQERGGAFFIDPEAVFAKVKEFTEAQIQQQRSN
ncbi:YdaS family helix-turn-helix protein [Spiribacter onubensis]|uniref:YdaS family helix-turn-helix protein n=1 Tax=Spiribacter onubensis TaxID=3122420 RepID=A0ABV3S8N6_9GAMM